MDAQTELEIFLVAPPGLEQLVQDEAVEKGFADPQVSVGGVTIRGTWQDVWRANLALRGPVRVLVRIGSFMAFHLAQLDKRARKFSWADTLRADVPIRVQVTCKASKIYHAKAASQRIETALRESLGVTVTPEADLVLKVRIHDNQVTLSLDTSGESLHKRGHKEAIGKAPMRENLAYLMLRSMGFDGTQTVVDPMCGSGTFVIEAAEIAAGLMPGRSRSFAFEKLASFDADLWQDLKSTRPKPLNTAFMGYGSDRDAGAIRSATANAERAGVAEMVDFANHPAGALSAPDGPPGIVIVNPPYGGRIGNKKLLYALYGSLGTTLIDRFAGWRAGLVTSEPGLARATGLPFSDQSAPIAHGGMKVWFWQTHPLR
ncbi:class I SAM-dependent RNA methyltransferase [Sulfitobacter sp. S190]|uniref:THUMP domain-containing class I SAM-dependent RNA methyltransferase n=1 Tax=Sulfitobacter sp. S190 TaxID=2867022 RepID=UPI0021A89049|nr:class I SAM-dependent RNA methyltransferase [Sulfitobacter sp. S190]UWR23255.1 class I SAM-dependent RNA methyltransferase [Sulfitobacter sp. S190]